MMFALNMAWRETRSAWRHFIFFWLAIVLGVATISGVAVFSHAVDESVTREARSLLGGDVEVRLSRPLGDAGGQALRNLAGRGVGGTHVSELAAMAARRGDGGPSSQLVELKAIEPGYPLYGQLQVEPPDAVDALLAERTARAPHYAVVQESLLIKLHAKMGDVLSIGEANFLIRGILRREPDRVATAFSLGPRVIISQHGLEHAKLVRPGSRVRERYLLRVPPAMSLTDLTEELRSSLAPDSPRISTYTEAQPQLRRFLDQLARYLGLIGLTALLVGGLGVSSTMRAFVKEKLFTIAVLKTLGAESGMIVRTYLVQALILGALGCAGGAALGITIARMLPPLFAGLLPVDLVQRASPAAWPVVTSALQAAGFGMLTTALFAIWPLLSIRDVRPALVFRHDIAESADGPIKRSGRWTADPVRWAAAGLITIALAGLSMVQAQSVSIGLIYLSALIVAIVLLRVSAALFVRMIGRRGLSRTTPARYAARNLSRPGSQAAGMIVAVGLGSMLIVAVSLLERSLVDEIGESRPADAPSFFFIDIQPDQTERFLAVTGPRAAGHDVQLTPLIRSRLHAVDGRSVQTTAGETEPGHGRDDREQRMSWYRTREYVLTFLDTLPKDNVVTDGAWWTPNLRPPQPLVSVEEEAAQHLGVRVGSILTFDIQGVPVSARVASIRKVEWSNFSTNFYMILSPGSLEGVPYTYVGTLRVGHEEESAIQQAVVDALPNVSAINIGEVMDNFARILEHLSTAIRAVAAFCLVSGAIVMGAALSTTRYRRLYESVVLKAIGATRGIIARAFAYEYAMLGAVAGFLGVLFASGLSWAVLHFIFELTWHPHPGVLAAGFVLTLLVTVGVGFLSTFRILGQSPLTILRHE